MSKRVTMAAGLILLAGCGGTGGGNETGGDQTGGDNAAVPATVPETTDENLIQDPQNHAVPLNPPAVRPSPAATPRS